MREHIWKEWDGLCPKCDNTLKFTVCHLPYYNDPGKVICQCHKCDSNLLICEHVVNPENLNLYEGGDVVEILDHDADVTTEIPLIKDQHLFDDDSTGYFRTDIFAQMLKGDNCNIFKAKGALLYKCKCGSDLESQSYAKLENLSDGDEYREYISNAWNHHSKSHLGNSDKIIIEFDFSCSCGVRYACVMYSHQFLYGRGLEVDHFLIANIIGTNSQKINGIYTKDECKSFVTKYALRWNLLAQKNYIATAYIGDQFKTSEQLKALWEEICLCFDSNKSQLITKTRTKNLFEKKDDEDGTFSLNTKYDRVPILQKNTHTFERSHAKFYAGILGDVTEVLCGSFNFTKGPSTENLIYFQLDTNDFLKNYLKPYGITMGLPDDEQCFFYKSFIDQEHNCMRLIKRDELVAKVLRSSI